MSFGWAPGINLVEWEKIAIIAAHKWCRGNKEQTAQMLGVSARTIYSKLEQYDKEVENERKRFESDKQRNSEILSRMRGIPSQSPQNGDEARGGIRLESSFEVSTQQSMPLPERKEVQELLPKQNASNHKQKIR